MNKKNINDLENIKLDDIGKDLLNLRIIGILNDNDVKHMMVLINENIKKNKNNSKFS